MNLSEISKWRHITKLDPDKRNTDELIKAVLESGTDAIMVSGTQRITKSKVERLVEKLKGRGVPVISEPVSAEAVTFDADYVFVPSVVNSRERWWFAGAHVNWIKELKRSSGSIPWEKIVPEAYIVLNPNSAVAKVTKAITNLSLDDVVAHALFADSFLNFPIVYVEYSGAYGDPKVVKAVREELRKAKLFYGGGIDSRKKAEEMGEYATIVVGNVVYEDLNKFKETVIH